MKTAPIIGIYCLTSPSGKRYIGKSTNILKRWERYSCGDAPNIHLRRAFQKYGPPAFSFDVLEIHSKHDPLLLDWTEQRYISLFETGNPNKGYNKTIGGDYGSLTLETREQISRACKGKLKGPKSLETKERMSLSKMGEKNYKSRKVYCIELDRVFLGLRQAEKELGIQHQYISLCCLGKQEMAGGFHWRYLTVS